MKKKLLQNYWKLALVAMLLIATLDLPYNYYNILRFAVCAGGVHLAFTAYKKEMFAWALLWGGLALIYNPFLPFYMEKDTWVLWDAVLAGLLLYSHIKKHPDGA